MSACGRPPHPCRVTEGLDWDGSLLTITVLDDRVQYGDIRAAIGVPAVGVLGGILACGGASDVDVVEHDVARVGHEVIILGAEAENQVRDDAVLQPIDADQHRAEDVDICGVRVIPRLSVSVQSATCLAVSPSDALGGVIKRVDAISGAFVCPLRSCAPL